MNKQSIYTLLEEKMLNYTDYTGVPVQPTGDSLVPIPPNPNLTAHQIGTDMAPYTGDQVYVREGTLARLGQAAESLAAYNTDLALQVVYGYRALQIQTNLFERFRAELEPQYDSEPALLSAVHRLVAVPDVAGHPTGGAVDIQITQGNEPLDFGTTIWEFEPDSYTFSPFVSPGAWTNRQLLRRTMVGAGFAPFDGEWWHFSYGDKEWAKYYGTPAALYQQVEFRSRAS
jgi:zinc D-Ala-D-Ala dipeptidase